MLACLDSFARATLACGRVSSSGTKRSVQRNEIEGPMIEIGFSRSRAWRAISSHASSTSPKALAPFQQLNGRVARAQCAAEPKLK
jgi:hypothetical protein